MAGLQKVAIVTGAGTGVGRAAALNLMKGGFTVVLVGRRKDKLDEVAKEGATSGGKGVPFAGDMRDPAAIKALFAMVKKDLGRLDVLFNNAGMGAPPVPFEELPVEKWKEVVDTNLTAIFVCTQEAFKIMKDQTPRGGRIINNGSISAHTPRPRSAAYTSTKHAVTGLTKSISLDGRAYDVACSQIDIGNALTEMAAKMTKGVPQANLEIKIEPTIDVNRVGEAVLYMAEQPLDVNVQFMTIMATKMPFVGRG